MQHAVTDVLNRSTRHSLRGCHDVPAAAFIHERPFLWLLAEVQRLITAFDQLTKGVRCSRPMAVGVTPMSMVTAVMHVTLQTETRRVGPELPRWKPQKGGECLHFWSLQN